MQYVKKFPKTDAKLDYDNKGGCDLHHVNLSDRVEIILILNKLN